jgi:hypothetical protein
MKNLWSLRYVILLLASAALAIAFASQAVIHYPLWIALAVAILVSVGFFRAYRQKRKDEKRGWGLSMAGFGTWKYKEKSGKEWRIIELHDLEDPRESPHVIGYPSEAAWSRLPDWAQGRRSEILERLHQLADENRCILKEA